MKFLNKKIFLALKPPTANDCSPEKVFPTLEKKSKRYATHDRPPKKILSLVRKCFPCKIFVVYSSHPLTTACPHLLFYRNVLLFNRNPSREQLAYKAIQKHEQPEHGHVDGDILRLHSFGGQPERLGRGLRDFGDDAPMIDAWRLMKRYSPIFLIFFSLFFAPPHSVNPHFSKAHELRWYFLY